MISHETAVEMLEAAALDVLPAQDQERVLAHAATCLICGPELAQLRDAAALMAYAVPPRAEDVVRNERIRTRLLERARSDFAIARTPVGRVRALTPHPGTQNAIPPVPNRVGWLGIAGWALAFAATVLLTISSKRDAQHVNALGQAERDRIAQVDSLQHVIDARNQMVAALTGPQVAVMELTSSAAHMPTARMFWDQATNRWTLIAHHLPALTASRTYQLWLVTRSGKISAGTFNPTASGDAVVEATYALASSALQAVAVTEEPAGGSPQPTSAPLIAAVAGHPAGA